MRNLRILILLLLPAVQSYSQELFVYTDPASNIAGNSMGIRLEQMLMKDDYTGQQNYFIAPKVQYGLSAKWMIQAGVLFSNAEQQFYANGFNCYAKYRFFSQDAVHRHFRMAAFARYAYNNRHIHEYAIDFGTHNSGYETGLIATQLLHKVAIAASTSFLHAVDNGSGEHFPFGNQLRNALNYTISIGALLLPRTYSGYQQTNMNLMLELLGQTNSRNGFHYIDLAPSIQFIFNSRMRVDVGYRYAMVKKLQRSAPSGLLLRLEYNLYNVFKHS